jgi:hypothetical protein
VVPDTILLVSVLGDASKAVLFVVHPATRVNPTVFHLVGSKAMSFVQFVISFIFATVWVGCYSIGVHFTSDPSAYRHSTVSSGHLTEARN